MSSTLRPYRPVPRARMPAAKVQARRGSVLWTLISPINIMGAIWVIALLIYGYASRARGDMLYFRFMAAQENLREHASTLSFVWLGFAFAAFAVGTLLVPRQVGMPSPAANAWSDVKATRILLAAFAVVATVAFLWLGVTVLKVGAGRLIALAASDNVQAREIILNGAFPGGRIISNGFIGLAAFSAMFLAKPRAIPLPATTKIMAGLIFVISLTYLGVVPILTSGRINFFAAIIASYVAICIVKRRIYGVAYLPIAFVLLITVWTAKQYFTLRHVLQVSAFDQSFQGLIFYVYNDMLNAMNVIGHLGEHYQWGYNSLRFAYFFTFTDGIALKWIGQSNYYLTAYVGGGEYPMLTAPYVDFGWFGLLTLVAFGAFSQFTFLKARSDPAMGALYGIVFAGLLLSIHSSYLTLQDPVFSMIMVVGMIWFARGRWRPGHRGY